jgi:hypothetical protein
MNSINQQNANQNGNSGRRNFLRRSAFGLAGGICAAGALTSAASAQERLTTPCTPDFTDKFFATFYEDIIKSARGNESLLASEVDDLAGKMLDEAPTPNELKNLMLKFYSLNASTVTAVLGKMREVGIENARAAALSHVQTLIAAEPETSALIAQLNQQSLSEINLPFHLALLRGWVAPFERGNSGPSTARSVSANTGAVTAANCPTQIYWRLVGAEIPWQLQKCWTVANRARQGSSVCDIHFGPFAKSIRGWVGFTGQIHSLVGFQGLGGKLLASFDSFSLKVWTLPLAGISPSMLPSMLDSRRL